MQVIMYDTVEAAYRDHGKYDQLVNGIKLIQLDKPPN
jgi:hypothetical protein